MVDNLHDKVWPLCSYARRCVDEACGRCEFLKRNMSEGLHRYDSAIVLCRNTDARGCVRHVHPSKATHRVTYNAARKRELFILTRRADPKGKLDTKTLQFTARGTFAMLLGHLATQTVRITHIILATSMAQTSGCGIFTEPKT